jgi:hypothetical protein
MLSPYPMVDGEQRRPRVFMPSLPEIITELREQAELWRLRAAAAEAATPREPGMDDDIPF